MKCGAKKRNGEPCQAPAMPNGRCRIHGGKSPGRPITHGRYSNSVPKDLSDRYEYFKTDPEILSLKPDLALCRAMMERYISTFVEGQRIGAGVADELRAWFDSIGRLAERCDKILNGERYTINVAGLQAIMAQIVDIISSAIEEHIPDAKTADKLRDSISRGLAGIHGTGDSAKAEIK